MAVYLERVSAKPSSGRAIYRKSGVYMLPARCDPESWLAFQAWLELSVERSRVIGNLPDSTLSHSSANLRCFNRA